VKYKTRVSLVIANAAECEPLLHKDKELLHHNTGLFLRGLQMAMEMVGAPEGAWWRCRMCTRRGTNSFLCTW
jgi:Na+-translocating ferredoxin:NAD+ oxidoreductase RnfC subunit